MLGNPSSQKDQAGALLGIIAQGLSRHADISTQRTLGDRTSYVGLSDIGRALECMRATVAAKLFPVGPPAGNPDQMHAALKRLLTLQRGHCFENLVGHALDAIELSMLRQVEIDICHQGTPIKAHLDFVLVSPSPVPTVRILECKSAKRLPDTLYTSYETQVYGQVGLLAAAWNTKAFTLRDGQGDLLHDRMTFPELCQAQFGIALPQKPDQVDLQAWVLCLSMTDGKAFGPYVTHHVMLDLCLKTAATLWSHVKDCQAGCGGIDNLPTVSGCHPLCAHCDWNTDCPKFIGQDHPDWERDLRALSMLKAQKNALEETIQENEEAVRTACAMVTAEGQWIRAGAYRCRVTNQVGRCLLDKGRLRQELVTLTDSHEDANELLSRCETRGQPTQRLIVSEIKTRPEATEQSVASSSSPVT